MRTHIITTACLAGLFLSPLAPLHGAEENSPPPEAEAEAADGATDQAATDTKAIAEFSRAVGMYMAMQAKEMGLDGEAAAAGFKAVLVDDATPPPQAQMMALQQAFDAARNRPIQDASDAIIAAADITTPGPEWKQAQGLPAATDQEFYDAFVKLEGVETTDSGLAYQVLEPGAEGAKTPAASDQVTVHYVGRHTSGEVFDSSIVRGEPTSFPLDGVIRGWTEGLQLMPVGSSYRFVIPGELAYGPKREDSERPTGVLIFDVSLLRID